MNWEDKRFPCCKRPIPAPLDCVERVVCACGQSFLPEVIEGYNELIELIMGWRSVLNGKARVVCAKGEESFVADLMERGIRLLEPFENIPNENRVYKS